MQKPSKNLLQPKWINIDDFEFICFNLTRSLMSFDEPIPDYSTRDHSLLESSLVSPRLAYELTNAALPKQTSILFYSLIKNHPFRNGNKRIAVMAVLVFLILNNKWLEFPPLALYKIAVLVAKSNPKDRGLVLRKNENLFNKYMTNVKF